MTQYERKSYGTHDVWRIDGAEMSEEDIALHKERMNSLNEKSLTNLLNQMTALVTKNKEVFNFQPSFMTPRKKSMVRAVQSILEKK